MITKQKQKLIHALGQKKQRDLQGLFVCEGTKTICELSRRYQCVFLMYTEEWANTNKCIMPLADEKQIATQELLDKLSLQRTPQGAIGIFKKNPPTPLVTSLAQNQLCLALDSIQDPGNLGTIIRIANWFGIKSIICSTTTADVYSPKVIQATMGALAGVDVFYTDLCAYLGRIMPDIPIYGTFLDGTDIYDTTLTSNGIIVMGNEGNGISSQVARCVTKRLYIPPYNACPNTTESLNVGVATAVTCAEFRRRFHK